MDGNLEQKKRILVIGGSGRVGGSAVRAICENSNMNKICEVTVGGRNINRWRNSLSESEVLKNHIKFRAIDIGNELDLKRILPDFDMIIHTAGPFQGLNRSTVLEYALKEGKLYLDVCDDINLSRIVRMGPNNFYQSLARTYNGTAVISTGIWPGCSSLLAQKMINTMLSNGNEIDSVRFSFFTAGSGGAGPTILSATFLILGEDVLTYKHGVPVYKKSATDSFSVDFGPQIGIREVARLNLIECESCFQHLLACGNEKVTVETYFGTSPRFWNTLFVWMANIIPQNILKDRYLMDILGKVSLPMVRLVDSFVGSSNAIRVDVTASNGERKTGLLSHADMEKSVGDAIAAFANQLLFQEESKAIPPGVYFPEEVPSVSFRDNILKEIATDAIVFSSDWK